MIFVYYDLESMGKILCNLFSNQVVCVIGVVQ